MKKATKRLTADLKNLPRQIQDLPRFLVWREEYNPKRGKKVKTPYYASGLPRHGGLDKPQDLAQLVDLETAMEALRAGDYTGIGLALVDGDGIAAFDIDKCLTPEGELLPDHAGRSLVLKAEREGAYIEVSPSGTGLRILGESSITRAYSKEGVEYWGRGRYVTLTGSVWANPGKWCSIEGYRQSLGPVGDEPPAGDTSGDILVTPRMVKELRSALAYIDSDERDTWIRIGHALRQLGTKGLDLWLEWSATSAKFDKEDALRVWSSMNPERTGFRAVFAEAQREGWNNPRKKGGADEFNPSAMGPDGEVDGEPLDLGDPLDLGPPELWPTEYVVDGFLPAGVSLIAGAWGSGKSTNLIPVFASVAHCAPEEWGLWPEIRRKVIWVTEAPNQARDTLYSLLRGSDVDKTGSWTHLDARTAAKDDLRVGNLPGEGEERSTGVKTALWSELKEWFLLYPSLRMSPKALARSLKELVEQHTYDLELDDGEAFPVRPVVVLDTTSANLDLENESDNSEVSKAMAVLKQELRGVPLVLVGHTSKATRDDLREMSFRGAGAWEADAEATYYLVHDEEIDLRFLVIRKCRFKPEFTEISFGKAGGREVVETPWGTRQVKSYVHGVPCPSQGDERRKAQKEAREAGEEQKQERAITERQTRIMNVVSRRTADQVLVWRASVAGELGGSRQLLFEAINRLIEAGRLKEVDTPRDFNPKKRGTPPKKVLLPAEVDEELFFERVRSNGGV